MEARLNHSLYVSPCCPCWSVAMSELRTCWYSGRAGNPSGSTDTQQRLPTDEPWRPSDPRQVPGTPDRWMEGRWKELKDDITNVETDNAVMFATGSNPLLLEQHSASVCRLRRPANMLPVNLIGFQMLHQVLVFFCLLVPLSQWFLMYCWHHIQNGTIMYKK